MEAPDLPPPARHDIPVRVFLSKDDRVGLMWLARTNGLSASACIRFLIRQQLEAGQATVSSELT